MSDIEDVQIARDFAIKAHGDQKYGTKPYVYHLDAVAAIVCESYAMKFGKDYYALQSLLTVAYLHDVLEDTKITQADLSKKFGFGVSDLVRSVTDEPGKNRRQRKLASYGKIRAYGEWAVLIKLADRIANVEHCVASGNKSLLQMYVNEQDGFSKALKKDGELTTLWARLDELCSTKAEEFLLKK